jgi:DnaK suppressor protein
MLNESQASEIRAQLQASRDRILGKAREASAFSRDRDKTRIGGDSVDLSAAEEHYGTELVLRDRENFLLNQINRCLTRLDAGVLDSCESCDEPIAFARLRVRPMATLCIECKEDRESDYEAE